MRVFSARALFNLFHSGYCSAYIQNPAYLLVVDFRSLEDWIVERVMTSHHHERLLVIDRSKYGHTTCLVRELFLVQVYLTTA